MAAHWGLSEKAVSIVLNGVTAHPQHDAEAIAALRSELGMPDGAFVIGSIGRLSHEKGYDRLLPAMSTVLPQHPAVCLLIVGDGPERVALEAHAQRLGIRDRVIMAGFQREARRFYELMNLFVMPSRSEGLSVSLLEAMAAGCPVLVTDVGENRRVLDDGAAGMLFPDDDGEWAEVIGRLLSDADEREKASSVARVAKDRVASLYAFEKTMDTYESAYQALAPVSS
jgi:glycosyltransferase involved in cell wall biosynthesis